MSSTSVVTRPAAVAGLFYPASPEALRASVRDFLDAAPAGDSTVPKVLLVPHAGYVYSGSTAAHGYAALRAASARIRRVVLIGPAHRVAVRGVAVPTVGYFATPLGRIELDRAALDALVQTPHVVASDRAHASEHALEVQLPFLQEVLGDFTLVPLVVGDASPEEVAAVLEQVWGGPETLIVVSSDLSHYLPYDTARRVDAMSLAQVLELGPELDHQQACGATPINALMVLARRRGLRPRLLAACSSGDTAGDRDRVVGYAALSFAEDAGDNGSERRDGSRGVNEGAGTAQASGAGDATAGAGEAATRAGRAAAGAAAAAPSADARATERGEVLLAHARHAIESLFVPANGTALPAAPFLDEPGATFVTLRLDGELRGCIGSLEAERPLREDVARNARAAALHDPRFPPLSGEEFDEVDVEVSLLSPAQPLAFRDEQDLLRQLEHNRPGLVLEHGRRRSTFLPQVWEQLPDPRDFLRHLKAKAGLPPDFWSDEIRVSFYTVEKWTER